MTVETKIGVSKSCAQQKLSLSVALSYIRSNWGLSHLTRHCPELEGEAATTMSQRRNRALKPKKIENDATRRRCFVNCWCAIHAT